MLRTGRIFRNALGTVAVIAMIIYMFNSYTNYRAEHGATTIFVVPSGIRILIWILIALLLLVMFFSKRK